MALNTQNSSELTREQVAAILTKPLERASKFLQTVPSGNIHDTSGKLKLPGAARPKPESLKWVGENEQIPDHDVEFGEFALLPDTMKSVKSITRYSNELARQSVVSLDQALKNRLVLDHARKIDMQFLGNTGDGSTLPRGLGAVPGVTTHDVDGPELALDDVLDVLFSAEGIAVDPDTVTMFINGTDYAPIRKAKDGDGRYMLQPDAAKGGLVIPALGVRTIMDPAIPAGTVTIADMSQVHVARDLAASVKILTERYADYDQQAIRTVSRYDMGAADPAGIFRITLAPAA